MFVVLSQFISYADHQRLSVALFTLENIAVIAGEVGHTIRVRTLVDIADQREVEQVGRLEEDLDTTFPGLLSRELHTEILVLPDVVVIPVGDVGEALADKAAGELSIDAMARIFVDQREVGDMGCLSGEGARLLHGDDIVALHGLLIGGDARVSEGVVEFDAEITEVFHQVDLDTGIVGITQIQRGVVCVLTLGDQTIFYRVLKVLIEKPHHHLLLRAGKELPAEVDIVGDGMFQVGISLLLILFVDDAVRHDLEETWAIDGACITEVKIHVGG